MVTFKSESEDAPPGAVQSTDYLSRGANRVSQKDRIRQRGVAVTTAMLTELLTGHTMEHNQACLIVEYHPTAGTEWLCAARDVVLDDATSSKFNVKLSALAFMETPSDASSTIKRLQCELYADWFAGRCSLPGIGRVDMAKLPDGDTALPRKPTFKLAYISEAGNGRRPTLAFPTSIRDRFARHKPVLEAWGSFVATHVSKYGQVAPLPANGGVDDSIEMDLSSDPPVVPPSLTGQRHVDLASIAGSTLARSPLQGHGKKISVAVVRSADERLEMWICSEAETETTLPAIQTYICSFGVGDWSFTAPGVPFAIESDTDYITLAMADQSRKTCFLCQLLRDLSDEGLTPKLMYHSLTPTCDPSGAPVANRWKVAVKKTASFVPAKIPETKSIDEIGIFDLGALFVDALDQLPLSSCTTVAECDTSPGGDPTQVSLCPRQMKLLLRSSLVVPPGKAVQLV
jgi:hypothetical protein